MTDGHSQMAASAICHAAEMAGQSMQMNFSWLMDCLAAPHVIYKPVLFMDGDEWCMLLGENLQVGVAGFGKSPAEAASNFDKAWRAPISTALHAKASKEGDAAIAAQQGGDKP